MRLACLLLIASLCLGVAVPVATIQAQDSGYTISLSETPIEYYRRAAEFVARLQTEDESDEAFSVWQTPRFLDEVYVMYRPDIEEPAYYEFELEPSGYIIVSAGQHDNPIAQFSAEDESPVRYLQSVAEVEIGRIYKLDTLYYVAEDTEGQIAASLGTPIVYIEGLTREALEDPHEFMGSASLQPSVETEDDREAGELDHELIVEGASDAPLTFREWESWEQLKAEYAEVYAVLIEDLRNQAAYDWETEALVTEFGEGIPFEGRFRMPLLYEDTRFEVTGDAADFVDYEVLDSGGFPVIDFRVRDIPPEDANSITVVMEYPTGEREERMLFIVSERFHGKRAVTALVPDYTNWYAGSDYDQRLYEQFDFGGCITGCGATAWAMLFGWADHQAALGNSYWSPRWGIYRVNGGYGDDADAPRYMANGIRNITLEIRTDIGTWCNGATPPWQMYEARRYLWGRTGAYPITYYNVSGIHDDSLRDRAADSILNRRTPAIIGTGWLVHYPLAYGYHSSSRIVRTCFLWVCWETREYTRMFYVNQGWGGYGNGWVGSGTWFDGELYP